MTKKLGGFMKNLSIKNDFNYSLFFSLMLLSFIPAINEVVKVLFVNINSVPMSVVSQIEWFDLIDEVLIVTLTVPLYSLLNKYVHDENIFKQKVFHCGIITISIYVIFSIITYINANSLISSMFSTPSSEIQTIETYLKLETIAFTIGIITTYSNVVFIVLGRSKYVCMFIIAKTLCLIAGNSILIPQYGSFGIAYSNILTNICLGLVAIFMIIKDNYISFTLDNIHDVEMFKHWFKVGIYQGISIAVANIVYAQMVVKMVNDVQGLGDYWIANNFIWGWLLVPAFALAELVKSDCKLGYKNLHVKNYYNIISVTVIVWLISIPFWQWIFKNLMGISDPGPVFTIVIKLLPFYIFYMCSNYIDSIFQGMGKTKYTCINNLLVNLVYYGILFILVKNEVFKVDLDFIILMFGFGMVFSFIINYCIKKRFLNSLNEKEIILN